MSSSSKVLDPAFQGVGQKPGTEIWRIENFQPVPLPKPDYGKFYMGDSYIVLQTTSSKGGSYLYDIHFWIGKDTSQDEAGTAAIKTVELDAVLGGRAVQHRELQGHESDKFLSYFKPCIIPLEGGIASGFKKTEEEEFETRLYVCKGKRVVRLKQVPFARSSLNHDDVFILDTQNKIYQFNGANSNIQERAKALEVIQFLKEKYHEGMCDVAIVDDGKLDTESDSGEFWVLFGGFAPIGKKATNEDDVIPETTPAKLYSITDGEVKLVEGELLKGILENNKCYLLDCGAEVFVWVGRVTQVDDRKVASQVVEDFVAGQNRPKITRITRVIQGYETNSFKSNFDSWPAGSTATGGEEGRGKVAALLKQQGIGVKGMSKSAPVNEEVPPLLEGSGKMEVWCINGSAKTPLPKEDIGKFYSGDCYIVLYTYHSGDRKEDYFLCCWIGKDSIEEDQKMAAWLANTMCNSLKGRPVQGRVFEGNEPPQFIALFQPMVVLKGGLSTGYKKSIADKGLTDETYTADCVALFQISGTSVHNNKALQVDAVATSLNSTECFLLQSGSSIFTWHGNQSTYEQQQLAAKVAEFLKPGVALKHAKEGTESSAFWFALGGKQSYTSKKASIETVRDPHLFTFSLNKGKFEVEEVYNFSQDDLLTEDILILDSHAEVFVWVGQSVDTKEKQNVFEIVQKYIDMAASLEGLSPNVPLYKLTEGNEPCFFTTFFSWDSTRATVQGNSFQKKVALLFGASHAVESWFFPKPTMGDYSINSRESTTSETQMSRTNTIISSNGPDSSSVQLSAEKLNEKNFREWAQSVKLAVDGRGKLGYLTGDSKEPESTNVVALQRWRSENSLITSWLINSMKPTIGKTYMFLPTAKEVWDAVRETYSDEENASQVFEIKTRLWQMKQGEREVTDYYMEMLALWQELDLSSEEEWRCAEDSVLFKKRLEKERVFEFLAGLNRDLDDVRGRILSRRPLPSTREVFAEVRREEARRKVMLKEVTTTIPEGSALVSRGTSSGPNTKQQKGRPWCEHCRKPGHSKDNCWEIHGKPADWKPRQNTKTKGYQACSETQSERQQVESNHSDSGSSSTSSHDQLQKIMEMLSALQASGQSTKNTPSGNLAHRGNFSQALYTFHNHTPWIIDSGASDHMTDSYHLFSSYTPCAGNLRVKIADGSLAPVAGKGSIRISDSITLESVLHVPKLSCNLLSISQLTKHSNCSAKFLSSHCVFQDLSSGTTIGSAKEYEGIYYFEEARAQDQSNGNQGSTQRASALAALSSAFNSSSASKTSAPKPSRTSQGSQRAAAVAALSSVLTAEKKKSPDASPTKSTSSTPAVTSPPPEAKSEVDPSEAEDSQEVAEVETGVVSETNGEDSEPKQEIEPDEHGSGSTQSTFSYEQLKAKSENPVTGIDFKRREAYLSDEEFQTIFGMAKEAFYKMPKWKQDLQKKKVDLF